LAETAVKPRYAESAPRKVLERYPGSITGGLGAKPQRGTGAESLLNESGGKVPEPGNFLGFKVYRKG